jgi:hypothetical protein
MKEKLNKVKERVCNAKADAGAEYRNSINGAHFHARFERNNPNK